MVGALPLQKVGEGRGIQEWSFWAELSDVWVLNLDPIFVSSEIDSALFAKLPTYRSRVRSLGPQECPASFRSLESLYDMTVERLVLLEKGLLELQVAK